MGFAKNQKGFADVIGCSDAYMSEIERGIKEPSLKILYAIEEKFDVSPATILWGLSEDHWNAIKQIFQSEESPDDVFQKLAPLLRRSVEDHGGIPISEPPFIFERSDTHQERRQPENASLRTFIHKVIKILTSGNNKIITALESNVEAFLDNIELRKSTIKEGD